MGRKEILVTSALCVAIVAVTAMALMPSQSCCVIYESNSEACCGDTRDGKGHASGDSVRVMECGFSRPGFTFTCWGASPDGTGATYSPGDTISVGGEVHLYAQWVCGEMIQSGDEVVVDEMPDIGDGLYEIDTSEFPSFKTLTISTEVAESMSGARVNLQLPGDVHARFGADASEAMASAAEAFGGPLSLTVDNCPTGLTAVQEAVAGGCDVYRITIEAESPIEALGGDVEFVLPHAFSGAEVTEVWCISDDGSVEVMSTEVGDGTVSFVTSHLSVFAVADMVPVNCSVRPADGQDIPAEVLASFGASVSSMDVTAVHHEGLALVGSRVSAEVWGYFEGYACALELKGATASSGGQVVTGSSLDAVVLVSRAEGSLPITVTQPSMGGTISVQSTAAEGDYVPVTAHPDDGSALKSVSVTCEDEFQTVEPTLSGFTMPSCPVEVTASFGRGSVMHAISLPADTKMYSVTASESSVEDGGSFRIQLTVALGYVKNTSFALRVNGSMLDLDSLDRCTVSSVHSDQTVTVEGIENAISHGVSVPSEQTGYVLSVDRDRIPEEESYTISFSILEGYREGDGFSVNINGSPIDLSSGSCLVENVLALQRVDVEGVELTPYSITAGANTSVICGGAPVSTATMMDVVTIVPAEGYELPASYATTVEAMGTVSPADSGYSLSGDTVFPSVWSVTAGRNTTVSAGFVVSGESVVVSADAGYELPVDYYDFIKSDVDVENDNSIIVDESISLPAIYSVTYLTGSNASSVSPSYYIEGTQFDQPANPTKHCYSFSKWIDSNNGSFFSNKKSLPITQNTHLSAKWIPDSFSLSIGVNIRLIVNEKIHTFKDSPISVTVEDDVSFDSDLSKPENYDTHLIRQNVLINDGKYVIRQDTEFKGIVQVYYTFPNVELMNIQYVIAGDSFLPLHYSKMSFVLSEYKMFHGWYQDNDTSKIITLNDAISADNSISLSACLSYRINYGNIVLEEEDYDYFITIGSHREVIDGNHVLITGNTTTHSITIYEEFTCDTAYVVELHDVNIEWPSYRDDSPIVNHSSTIQVITTGTTTIIVDDNEND